MNELLEINCEAIHLDLSNQNLRSSSARPILKALQHQSFLLQLDLSDNFLQNDGIKFLSQTLVTLKQLQSLDVSGNMMTESGFEYFCNALTKSHNPSEIRQLKLSFNPIGSNSLRMIGRLCQTKNITSLSMTSCDLTDLGGLDQLLSLQRLDISYNHLTSDGFKGFLRKLNPGIIEALNFERCSAAPDVGESLVQFINSGCYGTLKEINLSGLNLNENEILDILRTVEKCEQLNSLDLSNQQQLTFLSFKFLLFSMDSKCLERVKLIDCKNLRDSSHLFNPPHVDIQRRTCLKNIQLSLPRALTESATKDFIEKMKELWDNATARQGKLEQETKILRLICDEAKEIPFGF